MTENNDEKKEEKSQGKLGFLSKYFTACTSFARNEDGDFDLTAIKAKAVSLKNKTIEILPNSVKGYIPDSCMPSADDYDIDEFIDETYDGNDRVNGTVSVFPIKYIRKDEDTINFSKYGIKSLIDGLASNSKFKILFDQKDIKISLLEEGGVTDKFPVVRCEFNIPKSIFGNNVLTTKRVLEAIYDINQRKKWDDTLDIYEIKKQLNDSTQIVRSKYNNQLSLITEREFVDKRFYFEDTGGQYSFSTSLEESRFKSKNPKDLGVIRVINYFEAFTIKNIGDNIVFDSFHQIDIKIGPINSLVQMTLPLKLKNFSDSLIKYLKDNPGATVVNEQAKNPV